MNKKVSRPILAAALTILPATALAEPVQEWRCNTDSLAPSQALQRIEWARKCGLTTNSGGSGSYFTSTKAYEMSGGTFVGAHEYAEINHGKAYTGNLNAWNVNYYYGYARYDTTPLYTVAVETLGPTMNYYKWSHTTQRVRPLYPSFENTPVAGGGTQLFPHPTLADCRLYTDTGGASPIAAGASFYVIAYCESSCYTPDQNVEFSTGQVNIVDAMKQQRDDVVTLSKDATLDNITTKVDNVYSYTTETRDSEHVIFELTTASGGSLRVTNEHPVMISEGMLVKAEKLVIGDELLKADGTPDAIISVNKTTHFGKVYNIKPASRELVSNILIAQGYLVGSARFQNDDVKYMNRVLLFRGVPEKSLPR
jgi:hypothetical protein